MIRVKQTWVSVVRYLHFQDEELCIFLYTICELPPISTAHYFLFGGFMVGMVFFCVHKAVVSILSDSRQVSLNPSKV
jgi:hypothetical protein